MTLLIALLSVFILLDAVIVGYVVWKRRHPKLPEAVMEEIRNTWKSIIRQSDRRHAVLDADTLLDHTLSQMGFKGNLGTKLKKHPKLFRDLNGVWAAHKVRNNIAHQIHYEVDEKSYKKSMLAFKKAFQDLKVFKN